MVKQWFYLPLLCCLIFPCVANAEIRLQVEVEQDPTGEVRGILEITHPIEAKIDITSFSLEEEPIEMERVSSEKVEEKERDLLTTYHFTPPKTEIGLHFLPSVYVTIDGKKHRSHSLSYEVERMVPLVPLKLEGEVIADLPLYPGQRLTFLYRILYRGAIELEEQTLPFLEAKGFQKVGPLQVNEFTWQGYNVQEFTQEVQALEPGAYSFGTAFLTGYGHIQAEDGTTARFSLSAETSDVTLDVIPFPEKNRPPSFQGALGDFDFQVSLLSPNQVAVGDPIELRIEIGGKGAFHTVDLPELIAQPGFRGFFLFDDLPTIIDQGENKKIYQVMLRPETTLLAELPPIEFSFFSREKNDYKLFRSDPISLKVIPTLEPISPTRFVEKEERRGNYLLPEEERDFAILPWIPEMEEIETKYSVAWIVKLFFFAIILLALQKGWKLKRIEWKKKKRKKLAENYFCSAEKNKKEIGPLTDYLRRAFDVVYQEQETEQERHKIQEFLEKMDHTSFSKHASPDPIHIWKEGKQLFEEMRG